MNKLLFLFGVTLRIVICEYVQNSNRDIYLNNHNRRGFNQNIYEKFRDDEGYLGNPDDFANIERPCPVYDLHCIRLFFAKHSNCKITNGPVPDPFFRTQYYSAFIPHANVTGTPTNVAVTGISNARVEEFYINRATDNLVIAINFLNLTVAPRSTYFRFYRKGKEPITRVGSTANQYPSLTGTAIIPNINNLQLDQAEVKGYSDDAAPPLMLGPTIPDPTDPTVEASLAAVLSDIPTAIQELILTEAAYFPLLYIQMNICDFGLKLP